MIGEEDCAMNEFYHTSVQCISQTSTLLCMPRDQFKKIEHTPAQWQSILKQVELKVHSNNEKLISTMCARGLVAENLNLSDMISQ